MKNKALAQEILARVNEEQKVRKANVAGKAKRSEYKALDRKNTAWLKKVVAKRGWPTFSLVGKKAADGAWMLVQHADQDTVFQKHALRLMKNLLKKQPTEVSKERIAYLTDRILLNRKKPLEFGTHFDVNGLEVKSFPIRDVKNVNKRRKEYGMKTTVEERRQKLIRELKKLGAK